jgi:predicted phage terminase large subunit-like protein
VGRKRKLAQAPVTSQSLGINIELDADLMEGFVKTFLWGRYDGPKDVPQLHRSLWDLWCDPYKYCAACAPRGHGKTTAGTTAFSLAAMCFGFRDYILIIGSTEGTAVPFLQDIRMELLENDELRDTFSIGQPLKDNESELEISIGGRVCKIRVKGAEQKLRGMKWRGKRPNLVLCDDMEDDEQVMSIDRREKLRNWFFNAVLPIGGDTCLYRMLGTILHEDALLQRLMKDTAWKTYFSKAHESFNDFSNILWPEKFSEADLRLKRQIYINQGNPSGYAQEYLNNPLAESAVFFKRDCFFPMTEKDHKRPMTYYAALDPAIGQRDRNDPSAIVVGGLDPDGLLHIVDVMLGRWDGSQIIDEMFKVYEDYEVDLFGIEEGTIEKSIRSFLFTEMRRRGQFINMRGLPPIKDKPARAKNIQARHNSGAIRYNTEAEWYESLHLEMMQFPRSVHDDQVDAIAWLGHMLQDMVPATSEADQEEEDMLTEEYDSLDHGRCGVTGY